MVQEAVPKSVRAAAPFLIVVDQAGVTVKDKGYLWCVPEGQGCELGLTVKHKGYLCCVLRARVEGRQ